ncbi:hypothetical protein IAD21_02623 [Abditibacteriota bacterium]|nr:hypothetical protein IAD21_02623 [Abditibacteriota bacterium]
MRASNHQEEALPSPPVTCKRPKHSPRRAFSVAARAFLTLALATCALGAVASAQTISISPPANTPNTPEGNTGQTNFEFTVSIDQAPAQNVTVNFTINNGTAVGSPTGAGADFANSVGPGGAVQVDGMVAANNTITFPAGSVTSHTITVPVTGDTAFEADETFTVTLSGVSAGASLGTSSAQATIANDDNRPFISIADAAPVTEGNTGTRNANFTVSLNAISGQDVTFTYNTVVVDPTNAGDGINGDADFTPQNNQVGVIQAGQMSTNIAVPIIGDTIDEADGQFLVEISNVSGADIANGQGTGTILDDDGPIVSVSDATANESDGQIVFRVQLSAPSPQPITITYRTGSNSAVAGSDYGTQGSNTEVTGSVTFDAFAGDPSTGVAPFVDIPIPVIDDNVSEPPEIFSFTIVSANNNAALTGPGARRQATGTITDNDGSPNLTVTAPAGGVVEGNSGNTPAVFTVSLGNPSSRTVTFRYVTVAGTATENQDYTGISTSRVGTIAAGQSSTTISVNVIGDLIDEPNETFGLRVFSAAPNDVTVNGSTEQTAFATIIDDDGPSISVTPANRNVTEGDNGGGPATAFTVQLSAASPQVVTVRYTLSPGSALTDATLGRDYTPISPSQSSGILTFPAGTTTQQVGIKIIGDNIKEQNELITLTLSAPNGGSLPANPTGTITILDDDATPVINIAAQTPSAIEGSNGGVTNFVFRVTLDRASSQDITVNFTVNDGTAVAGPPPTGDFTVPGNSPLTFPAGTIGPQNIIVPVSRDNLNEDDETFSVSLSGPTNARIGTGSATATIRNDDALPAISIQDATGLETGDPPPQGQQQGPRILQFQVTLSRPSGKDVTFSYITTGAVAGANTFTAIPGVDFVPAQNQVTIPAGQTTPLQPVTVTIISDTLDEDDETFGVSLLNVTNATISRGSAVGRISDDDAPPNIKIDNPAANNSAIEPYSTAVGATPTNGRNAIFPVTLSTASGRVITVRYTISGGPDPAAFNNDFLANANDPTRIFQTGTLTFTPVNGRTPTTQNIVVFPRGDDGDEDANENFVVNITATNANFAAPADASADSTVADRDPNFDNFTPDTGYESFNNTLGTIITITGNQFITDGQSRVQAVRFTGPTGVALNANIINITATTITCRLPFQAYSSFVTVVLTSGRVLNSTDPGSRRLFYAQPVVTGFNPGQGVPAVTGVTITGRHFQDPRNPVSAVLFNGLASTAQNADRGFTIISDTQILAYVPRDATSGPISIRTVFGGNGPPSEQTFTVNSFNTGSVRLVAADTTPIYENAQATIRTDNGQILNPVRSFTIQLTPATQNNGNNTPIAPRRTVDVTVTLTAAVPAGNAQALPIIQLDPRVRTVATLVRSSGNSFTFRIPAGTDPNTTFAVIVTYAGDDTAPPAAQGALSGATDPDTGLTLPVGNSGVQMTLRTEITASADGELYPVGGFQEIQFERRDIHTFATDTGTALRTTEDQNSPNNRTSFAIDLANLDFPNPDPFTPNSRAVTNPINTDARPKADVVVAFTSSNLNEGRLTYYVLVNGQKVYPSGAGPQNTIQVIYATSPARAEYYRNPHFVEVIGQDDQVSDGDQQFVVTATTSTSKDPEYNIPLQLPFVLVNTDNEQGNGRNDQGFLFSKTNLNTDENGQQDVFTTSLRTRPTGNVSITFQSTRVDEVLFVDPNNPTGPGLSSLTITYLASGTGNGKTTTFYQTPLAIRVVGVDDDFRDGDQQALITTTVIGSADAAYGSIDPPDLVDTNRDNEANGITVFPTTLTVNENTTSTFSIRLNARPTSNVVITLASSDPNTVTIDSATTLTFTPSNYNVAQTVTVRGVPDGGFTQQRTASIITSAASSGDPNFNGLDVADVTVTVFNNDSAFVVNAPAAGLRTSESGTNDVFTVSLGQAPTTNVSVILSANPASEARLSRTTAGATPSLTLTFTPTNYANPQTVNVIGQDDTIADGDKAFTITGRVTTTDPVYTSQPFPALTGTNADNETGTGGGGGNATTTSFAANSTYTFSTPYAIGTAATATIPVRSLFVQSSVSDFKIYRFDVANQKNSRLIGQDFQLVPNTGSIQRGIGYILQTGATPLTLKTPSAVQAYNGTGFSFVLTRNPNFVSETGQTNANNGLNFIGFPFNPAQFGSVSFATAMVQSGSDTYQSVSEAAAAGVISDKLYTMNSKGQLIEVPAGSQVLRPYGAYFVRIYRDSVTLTFRSPSAN